ncbi:hypothetical protein GCM10009099_30500 [Caenispirillum bisanense]
MLLPGHPHLLEVANSLLDAARWLEASRTAAEMDCAMAINRAVWLSLAALTGHDLGLPRDLHARVQANSAYVQEVLTRHHGAAPDDPVLSRVAQMNLHLATTLARLALPPAAGVRQPPEAVAHG